MLLLHLLPPLVPALFYAIFPVWNRTPEKIRIIMITWSIWLKSPFCRDAVFSNIVYLLSFLYISYHYRFHETHHYYSIIILIKKESNQSEIAKILRKKKYLPPTPHTEHPWSLPTPKLNKSLNKKNKKKDEKRSSHDEKYYLL